MESYDKGQGGLSGKFAKIPHSKPLHCNKKNSRSREFMQKPRLTRLEARLLRLLDGIAGADGSVTKPLRYYCGELGCTRYEARNAINALESKGYLRMRAEWQGEIKRMRLCLRKEDTHESKD